MSSQGIAAIKVGRLARVALHPVVEQGIAGAGVECQKLPAAPDESDIGNSADVHESQRTGGNRSGQGAVIYRHEGSTLPAHSHIGSTKVADDAEAGQSRKQGAIAQLHRQALVWIVQNRMAVKADNVDLHAF